MGIAGGSSRDPTTPPIVDLDDDALAFLDATTQRIHTTQELERRRRTRTITVLSSLLVLALIAAGIAVWQQQLASDAQHTTVARSMVAQADRIHDHDPRSALQLGVAAEQFDGSPQTEASFQQNLTSASHFRTLRGHNDAVHEAAFAPDGRTLITTSGDKIVIVWELPPSTGSQAVRCEKPASGLADRSTRRRGISTPTNAVLPGSLHSENHAFTWAFRPVHDPVVMSRAASSGAVR